MKVVIRRPFMLLEVMIAFAFVVSAFFPLVYPHFYIYHQQRQFIEEIDIDIVVSALYAAILVKMQTNEITWHMIEQKQVTVVDEAFWRQIGYTKKIPFTGRYHFSIAKQKKNDQYGLALVDLTIAVTPNWKKRDSAKKEDVNLVYKYEIFVSRLFT